jgi:hypothetical protein
MLLSNAELAEGAQMAPEIAAVSSNLSSADQLVH